MIEKKGEEQNERAVLEKRCQAFMWVTNHELNTVASLLLFTAALENHDFYSFIAETTSFSN